MAPSDEGSIGPVVIGHPTSPGGGDLGGHLSLKYTAENVKEKHELVFMGKKWVAWSVSWHSVLRYCPGSPELHSLGWQ
jgi:hypothetical protein